MGRFLRLRRGEYWRNTEVKRWADWRSSRAGSRLRPLPLRQEAPPAARGSGGSAALWRGDLAVGAVARSRCPRPAGSSGAFRTACCPPSTSLPPPPRTLCSRSRCCRSPPRGSSNGCWSSPSSGGHGGALRSDPKRFATIDSRRRFDRRRLGRRAWERRRAAAAAAVAAPVLKASGRAPGKSPRSGRRRRRARNPEKTAPTRRRRRSRGWKDAATSCALSDDSRGREWSYQQSCDAPRPACCSGGPAWRLSTPAGIASPVWSHQTFWCHATALATRSSSPCRRATSWSSRRDIACNERKTEHVKFPFPSEIIQCTLQCSYLFQFFSNKF